MQTNLFTALTEYYWITQSNKIITMLAVKDTILYLIKRIFSIFNLYFLVFEFNLVKAFLTIWTCVTCLLSPSIYTLETKFVVAALNACNCFWIKFLNANCTDLRLLDVIFLKTFSIRIYLLF